MKVSLIEIAFLWFLAIFCLISCNPKTASSDESLVFDTPSLLESKGEIKMSEFCDSVDFVVLKPHVDWFFPPHAFHARVLNKYILALNNYKGERSIGVFKRNGDFILKLNKLGKGPGEYGAISDFGMDLKEEKIWVLDKVKPCLCWYDLQGTYLNTIRFPTTVNYVCVLHNGEYLLQTKRLEPDAYNSTRLFLTDRNGNFKRSVWDKLIDRSDYSNIIDKNWIAENGNELFYRDNSMSDTLFKLDGKFSPEPFFVINNQSPKSEPKGASKSLTNTQGGNGFTLRRIDVFDESILLQVTKSNLLYIRIDRQSKETVYSEKLTDDLLGLNFPFGDRSIHSDCLFRILYVPTCKEHPDEIFTKSNSINPELQHRLRNTLAQATDDTEVIVVVYKLK